MPVYTALAAPPPPENDVTPGLPVTDRIDVSVGFRAPSRNVALTAPPTPPRPPEPEFPEPPPAPTTLSVTQHPAAILGGQTYRTPSTSLSPLARVPATDDAVGDEV